MNIHRLPPTPNPAMIGLSTRCEGLLHHPPRDLDRVYSSEEKGQFDEQSYNFLHNFDATRGKTEKLALLGGGVASAATGIGTLALMGIGSVTLIELMIAVASAGIVAAVVIPFLHDARNDQAQANFVEHAPAPFLQQADGWLTADQVHIDKNA